MPLEDEMPEVPQTAPGTVQAEAGDIDAGIYDDVPKMGEPLPKGTYHFRLDSYTQGTGEAEKDDPFGFGAQPYFQIIWSCQQEPFVGRSFMDFAPWITPAVARAAVGPNSDPKVAAARSLINKRLWKSKAIVEAAGLKPTGSFSFKNFLDTNPEVKIQLAVKERKEKASDGTYKGTGIQGNSAAAYLPLHRPQ